MPLIVSWPRGIPVEHQGELRDQYQYVTDLLPTILELAGVDATQPVRRRAQLRRRRARRAPTRAPTSSSTPSASATAASTATAGSSSRCTGAGAPYDDGEWELYDLRTDPTETRDLAADATRTRCRSCPQAWERAGRGEPRVPARRRHGSAAGPAPARRAGVPSPGADPARARPRSSATGRRSSSPCATSRSTSTLDARPRRRGRAGGPRRPGRRLLVVRRGRPG